MITISFNGILYDWYAASRLDSLKECPNDLLYWGAIEYGIDNNYKTFDFGGAGFKDEPYGPRDFKSQFGGKEITIGRYIRINHPLMFKFSMKCFELTRKWFT
jgi:lipid II:glycine glycyltransferase (peptidoglycan interpeptide bridge formation enzyme)